jgi:hypothetical protein
MVYFTVTSIFWLIGQKSHFLAISFKTGGFPIIFNSHTVIERYAGAKKKFSLESKLGR